MGLREDLISTRRLFETLTGLVDGQPRIVSADVRPGRRRGEYVISIAADQDGEPFVTSIQATPRLLQCYMHGLQALLRGRIQAVQGGFSETRAAGMCGIGEGPEAEGLLRSFLTKNKLHVRQQAEGNWTGCVTVNTSLGEITLCATVEPQFIQSFLENVKGLHDKLHEDQGGEAAAGNIFGSIAKLARRIARGRLLQRLGGALQAIARNPIISKAVGIASSVIPGVGAVRMAVTSAAGVLNQLRRKNPATRRQVAALILQARRGNRHASRAVRILSTVNRMPPAAAAGFLYHRPMRPASSLWSARDTYLRGLGTA